MPGETEIASRKERERAMRRNEIVIAACDVFASRGFNDATLEEIAEKAEFGKGTLYNYFDSKELLFHRTNRRQNIMELAACQPVSGVCRTVVHEEWLPSWTENSLTMRWLDDGKRFIWESERTGFKNYYLYDVSGKLIAPLTQHPFEVAGIVKVDEAAKVMWYYARSGDNYMKQQLHRVGLDGKGDVRLTDPAFNHNVSVSPDGKFFTDIAQAHDAAPVTTLREAKGKQVAVIAESDVSALAAAGGAPKIMRIRDLGQPQLPAQGAYAVSDSDGVGVIGELLLIEGDALGKQPTVHVGGRAADVLARLCVRHDVGSQCRERTRGYSQAVAGRACRPDQRTTDRSDGASDYRYVGRNMARSLQSSVACVWRPMPHCSSCVGGCRDVPVANSLARIAWR